MSHRVACMATVHAKAVMSFAVVVSVFGLGFTSVAILSMPPFPDSFAHRKPLIGAAFAAICILGALAVLFPKQCSAGLPLSNGKLEPNAVEMGLNSCTSSRRRGHHPDCGRYDDHVITLDSRCLCAACTGLFVGAMIALSGVLLYFFLNLSVRGFSMPLVLLGQAGIVAGLVQFKFKRYIRASANSFFVVAALLILAGVDEALGSTFIDLYCVLLIVFWLFTRILISSWDHERICRECPDHGSLAA